MKPFNLEKAVAGEPLVTRDGKPATQFTRFDVKEVTPCFCVIGGVLRGYTIDGKYFISGNESQYDLFMAEPERWVNIYWNDNTSTNGAIYKSEAEAIERIDVSDGTIYQTTIKLK